MTIIRVDGVRTELQSPDLDNDGLVGGVERISQGEQGITHIQQPTELGESLKELNNDGIDISSRMSNIDMRSRLHPVEITKILALDALVAFGVCPVRCLSFTRQKKRLSVSLSGKGREEIVNIVGGKKEQDASAGASWFSRFTGGGQK